MIFHYLTKLCNVNMLFTYFSSKYFEETLLPKSAIMSTFASLRKLDTVLSPINPLPNYAYLIFVLKNDWTEHSYYQIPIIMNGFLLRSNSVWLKAKNAENFSTKALAIKVVLFAFWRSTLAYERQKLMKRQTLQNWRQKGPNWP